MPTALRPRALTRLHGLTGAPALALGWASALVPAANLSAARGSAHDWLPSSGALLVWWLAAAVAAALHVAASFVVHRAGRAQTSDTLDEGRTLRVAAGALALVGVGAALAVLAPAAFGDVSAAEVYGSVDALLSVLPGLGAACVVAAAGGLYVADELPRVARLLGASDAGPRARATQVLSMALGVILFALSMNVVSHFSVGGPLLGSPSHNTPAGAP